VGGDQDRAVDALLAMSDPDHVPAQPAVANEQPSHVRHVIIILLRFYPQTNQPTTPTPHTPVKADQTQLDEEFARQLLLEDEQQYARDQIALRQQQQQEQMRQFPYAQRTQPSIHRGDAAQQQQQSLPQRDTMSDMQEQFSKLAESTFRFTPSRISCGFVRDFASMLAQCLL
jgi:hypothetical protein